MANLQTGSAEAILAARGGEVGAYLRRLLGEYAGIPPRLREAMEYSLLAGGKRLRPALVMEFSAACGGGNSAAMAAAAAIELVHTFSLVHDDLPAMDDDDLRRGRATNHKVFGEAMAILAGDAMVMMAFEILAREGGEVTGRLVGELARASGAVGMIGGQVVDMESEGKVLGLEELKGLHRLKTGALLRCACRMGVIAGGGSTEQLEAATRYGEHLGLAFQIVDDLLDVTGTAEQLGKAAGKDAKKGKNTYPALMGVDRARQEAEGEISRAVEAIGIFGGGGEGLRKIAEFVVRRGA